MYGMQTRELQPGRAPEIIYSYWCPELPLPTPPLVRVNTGDEEEGTHSCTPGHLHDPGHTGLSLATDKNPLKSTLKEPGGSSKCIPNFIPTACKSQGFTTG